MGKTKIATIDDSQPQVEEKKKSSRKRVQKDSEHSDRSENRTEQSSEQKVSESEGQKEQSDILIPSEISDSTGTPSSSEFSGKKEQKSQKKVQKPGKAKPRSKKYQEVIKDLDRSKTYPIPEAVDMVKKLSYAKFNATLEAHINTTAQGLRGLVSLPFASGQKLRILAFGKGADTSGADFVGANETIEDINKGKVEFDLLVTTPEWMPKLAKVAKVLGPKGLMPNPKNGTITEDLKKAVEGFQAGKTEYKTEPKAPVIHLGLGKLDQPTEELSANVKTLLQTLGKTRVKKVTLSPTMGPSVKVDLASI